MIGVIINTYLLHKVFVHEGIKVPGSYLVHFFVFNLSCAVTALTYVFLRGMICLVPYILCAFWLAGVAYADYASCNVYEIMEYYAVIPVLLSVINIINNDTAHTLFKLYAALATVTAYHVMAKTGIFGDGDSDVLSVVCAVYFDAYYNCIFFGLVMVLFVIRNFGVAFKNRGGPDSVRPLVPCIYMAYILMLPFVPPHLYFP